MIQGYAFFPAHPLPPQDIQQNSAKRSTKRGRAALTEPEYLRDALALHPKGS